MGIKQGIQTLHWINTKKLKQDNKPKGDNSFLLLGDMCWTLAADTILESQVFHISTVKGIFTCDVLLHLQPWSKLNYVAIWISPFTAGRDCNLCIHNYYAPPQHTINTLSLANRESTAMEGLAWQLRHNSRQVLINLYTQCQYRSLCLLRQVRLHTQCSQLIHLWVQMLDTLHASEEVTVHEYTPAGPSCRLLLHVYMYKRTEQFQPVQD